MPTTGTGRRPRVLTMVLAGVGVLVLGFVVAMASASVPGRREEPLLDVAWRPGASFTEVLTWLVAIAVVIGAVVLMSSAREPRMRRGRERRVAALAVIVGLLLFFLAWRYLRPVAGSLLEQGSVLLPGPTDAPPSSSATSSQVWVLGALIGLVVIAALVRLGMSLRSPKTELESGQFSRDETTHVPITPQPAPRSADPRGRIFGAYLDFEEAASDAGVARDPAETAGTHARRVVASFSLPQDQARALVARHAEARFGAGEPTAADADLAESASSSLRRGIAS